MSKPKDGGPAFPCPELRLSDGTGVVAACDGMSLRDWLAGQCDPSVYFPADAFETAKGHRPTIQEMAEYIADIRFIEADAMLARREPKP